MRRNMRPRTSISIKFIQVFDNSVCVLGFQDGEVIVFTLQACIRYSILLYFYGFHLDFLFVYLFVYYFQIYNWPYNFCLLVSIHVHSKYIYLKAIVTFVYEYINTRYCRKKLQQRKKNFCNKTTTLLYTIAMKLVTTV